MTPPPSPSRRTRLIVGAVLVALYLAAAIPLILTLGPRGRPGEDQINFHEPAIRTFAQQLPTPDLHDYKSATTPGYHLVLAAVARFVSDDARALRLAGALFTAGLLFLLGSRATTQRAPSVSEGSDPQAINPSSSGPLQSLIICLPVLCSLYVIESGVWLLPDNAGWLFVLAVLLLSLRHAAPVRTNENDHPKPHNRWLLDAAALLIALVMTRQIHIWAAGLVWAAAWLRAAPINRGTIPDLLSHFPTRIRRLIPALLATAPAFVLFALFAKMWGGFTPPSFQGQYKAFNFAAPAFILSILGVASVFFCGFIWEELKQLLTRDRLAATLAALGGAALAIIPNTTYSVAGGRYSGLWNLALRTPMLAGHTSVVIVALSAFGAVMLLAWSRALRPHDRWVCLGAFAGFAAAQAASFQLWQRYNEPMVLMMLTVMAARSRGMCPAAPTDNNKLPRRARTTGPLAFALALAALAAFLISRYGPAHIYDLRKELEKLDAPTPPDPR